MSFSSKNIPTFLGRTFWSDAIFDQFYNLTSDFVDVTNVFTYDWFIKSEFDYLKTTVDSSNYYKDLSKKELFHSDYINKILLSLTTIIQFEKELNKKRNLISGKENIFSEGFYYLIKAILPLKPVNIDPKITASNSIYTKFLLENNYLIRLELFFDQDNKFCPTDNYVVLNIDENNEQIFGAHCTAEKAIDYLYKQIEDLPTVKELNNTSDTITRSDIFEEQATYSTSS